MTDTDFTIGDYLEDLDSRTRQGKCKACKKRVQWSREKVAAHKRASCHPASDEERRKFAKRSFENLNDSSSSASGANEHKPTKPKRKMTQEQIREFQSNVGSFFFRTGISLRLVESRCFKDMFDPEIADALPNSKTLSGRLLDQQYENSSKRLNEILEESENLTLVSDGWTNNRGDHIVNFCIKSPGHKTFFHSSINTSGSSQNAVEVANCIINVIERIGPKKFSSVITDNAPVMKAAWKLIEIKFPHILCYGCAAHGMDLLIKDLLSLPGNASTLKDAEKIIKFITNHHIVKAKYEEKRKLAKVPHTLSMPVATRWFSRFTSLNDLHSSKYVLIKLVDEDEGILSNINPKLTSAAVINLIKSGLFWDKLSNLVKLIEYPANAIGKLEADDAPLSLVYHYFSDIYKHFANDSVIQEKVKSRYQFLANDCIRLAYMLTPKSAAEGTYFDNDRIEIMSYFEEFALRKDPDSTDQAKEEMIKYVTKMSTLSQKHKDLIFKMSAKQYWSSFGRHDFPALYKMINPLLEMHSSSAAAERTWSTFKFIHSRLRNRLTNERVEKLVFVFINCTLLDDDDKNDYILEEGALLNGIECEETSEDEDEQLSQTH